MKKTVFCRRLLCFLALFFLTVCLCAGIMLSDVQGVTYADGDPSSTAADDFDAYTDSDTFTYGGAEHSVTYAA